MAYLLKIIFTLYLAFFENLEKAFGQELFRVKEIVSL